MADGNIANSDHCKYRVPDADDIRAPLFKLNKSEAVLTSWKSPT